MYKRHVKINCHVLRSFSSRNSYLDLTHHRSPVDKTVCLSKFGPVSNMHQLNYKTSMSNFKNGFSAQF